MKKLSCLEILQGKVNMLTRLTRLAFRYPQAYPWEMPSKVAEWPDRLPPVLPLLNAYYRYFLSLFPRPSCCKTTTRLQTTFKWTKGVEKCDREGEYQASGSRACIQAPAYPWPYLARPPVLRSKRHTRQSYFQKRGEAKSRQGWKCVLKKFGTAWLSVG